MNPTVATVLRWIGVLPAFVASMYLTFLLWGWSMYFAGEGDLVQDLRTSADFGGHYILGPLYCLGMTAAAAALGILAATFTAPSHRKVVRMVFVVVSALLV